MRAATLVVVIAVVLAGGGLFAWSQWQGPTPQQRALRATLTAIAVENAGSGADAGPYYQAVCTSEDMQDGCMKMDNPMPIADVPNAFYVVNNLPDSETTHFGEPYDFSVSQQEGTHWHFLGTWHPQIGLNCNLGIDCAPGVFGRSHVEPGIYRFIVNYGGHHLSPFIFRVEA